MRYFVLTTPGGDEVVRVSLGAAAYFESTTRRWVPDPLLAVEVRVGGEWREVESHELPPGIIGATGERPRSRKSRSLRRGRHSRK